MSRLHHIQDGDLVACDEPSCSAREFVEVDDVPAGWHQGVIQSSVCAPYDACSEAHRLALVTAASPLHPDGIEWTVGRVPALKGHGS